MREKKFLKILFILSCILIFSPWFTYNAKMMGYCWGWEFLKFMLIPQIIIAKYLFFTNNNKLLLVISELAMLTNMGILVVAFCSWQNLHNIVDGFRWKDGLYTAQPTFWLTAVVYIVFFIVFQIELYRNKN